MARILSLPIVGDPNQALTQIQNRLDAAFGSRIDVEFVRDNNGLLIELLVKLSDSLPEERVKAFRRSLESLGGRLGAAVLIPTGSGGAVSSSTSAAFDALPVGGAPQGFSTIGDVVIDGGSASGPNLLHTDGGTGLTLDLSTTPITVGLPIAPGSLSIDLDIGTSETITDDGLGNLVGSNGSLPGGGAINYTSGAMTGTTAALTASSTVNETHSINVALSPAQSVKLGSGATASTALISYRLPKAQGEIPAELNWSFNVNFPPDFGLNNNAVSGAQPLTLAIRLRRAFTSGHDIVLQWATVSDDTTPPTDWGTPSFTEETPTETPTAALALPIDASYYNVTVRRVSDAVLGVSMDGTEELFTFSQAVVLPEKVEISHTWGDALDRYFSLDDWSLSYSLPSPE